MADGEGGKDVSGGGRFTHMTMWAKDAAGLRNLFQVVVAGQFLRATTASRDGSRI
ncbi:hypothetical protein [Nonomuraea dietziae]|uniref:hypothetical protein n=1 Tax=Nonomuraea dietziae TaxID=65515 RepID=UPI003CD0838C